MNGYCFRLVRFLLLLVLSVNVAWAEGRSEDTVIYGNCAQMPVLNYRHEPSRQWLEVFSHTRFAALPALRMDIQVEFVVEKDGRLTHARVLDSPRSEEHTSELQSRQYLVCRLLLEKKKNYIL